MVTWRRIHCPTAKGTRSKLAGEGNDFWAALGAAGAALLAAGAADVSAAVDVDAAEGAEPSGFFESQPLDKKATAKRKGEMREMFMRAHQNMAARKGQVVQQLRRRLPKPSARTGSPGWRPGNDSYLKFNGKNLSTKVPRASGSVKSLRGIWKNGFGYAKNLSTYVTARAGNAKNLRPNRKSRTYIP